MSRLALLASAIHGCLFKTSNAREFDLRYVESKALKNQLRCGCFCRMEDGCYHLMLSEDEWGIAEVVCDLLQPFG